MADAVQNISKISDSENVSADSDTSLTNTYQTLKSKILDRSAVIGVIGLGYVGMPLIATLCDAGYTGTGFDVNETVIKTLNYGKTHIGSVDAAKIKTLVNDRKLEATSDFSRLAECDVILIAVPTPLTEHRDPDLSYVINTAENIAKSLRKGQMIILESTTYPGTMADVVTPILEGEGLKCNEDFFIAYSPEREDPGNKNHNTKSIPKVVGADTIEAQDLVESFYKQFIDQVVVVSSSKTAESVKLMENIFRSVNIALVNELKIIFEKMDIDIWEVIEAAKTKPFGFMPFYPGPGLGGHCIPIDPFYLSWKAREHDVNTRFIELAGEINVSMPKYVVERTVIALNDRFAKSVKNSKILICGLTYKKNVNDTRESPAWPIMKLLQDQGALLDVLDPFLNEIPKTRKYPEFEGWKTVDLADVDIAKYDAVIIVTDHDSIDYERIAKQASLIIDTRNVMKFADDTKQKIVKA